MKTKNYTIDEYRIRISNVLVTIWDAEGHVVLSEFNDYSIGESVAQHYLAVYKKRKEKKQC